MSILSHISNGKKLSSIYNILIYSFYSIHIPQHFHLAPILFIYLFKLFKLEKFLFANDLMKLFCLIKNCNDTTLLRTKRFKYFS